MLDFLYRLYFIRHWLFNGSFFIVYTFLGIGYSMDLLTFRGCLEKSIAFSGLRKGKKTVFNQKMASARKSMFRQSWD